MEAVMAIYTWDDEFVWHRKNTRVLLATLLCISAINWHEASRNLMTAQLLARYIDQTLAWD